MCRVTGNLSLDELKQLDYCIVRDYLNQAESLVHVFVDVREMKDFPRNLIQVREAVKLSFKHSSMGWEILVGHQNPIVRFLASVVCQMSDINLHMVNTPEEGFAFLATLEPELAQTNQSD